VEQRAPGEGAHAEPPEVVDVARAHRIHDAALVTPRLCEVGGEVAGDAARRETGARGDEPCSGVPGLLRNAAAIEARPAPDALLDDRDLEAAQRAEDGGAIAAGAGTDDDEVEGATRRHRRPGRRRCRRGERSA
jgi:hypothetical protein